MDYVENINDKEEFSSMVQNEITKRIFHKLEDMKKDMSKNFLEREHEDESV